MEKKLLILEQLREQRIPDEDLSNYEGTVLKNDSLVNKRVIASMLFYQKLASMWKVERLRILESIEQNLISKEVAPNQREDLRLFKKMLDGVDKSFQSFFKEVAKWHYSDTNESRMFGTYLLLEYLNKKIQEIGHTNQIDITSDFKILFSEAKVKFEKSEKRQEERERKIEKIPKECRHYAIGMSFGPPPRLDRLRTPSLIFDDLCARKHIALCLKEHGIKDKAYIPESK